MRVSPCDVSVLPVAEDGSQHLSGGCRHIANEEPPYKSPLSSLRLYHRSLYKTRLQFSNSDPQFKPLCRLTQTVDAVTC
jgi:hypothetical protein